MIMTTSFPIKQDDALMVGKFDFSRFFDEKELTYTQN